MKAEDFYTEAQRTIIDDPVYSFPEVGKGTYILILRLRTPARISVGKLGAFDFRTGWYAYVGSAMGTGGLRGRLKHHLTPVKKPHWHIDYLRQSAVIEQVWYRVSHVSHEHEWANHLHIMVGVRVAVPRFGASDCGCVTHLFYFAARPDMAEFPLESLSVWNSS
jgi:Uri superfamily endonuclease